MHWVAGVVLGEGVLSFSFFVVLDNRGSDIDDVLGRSVVLLQSNFGAVWELLFEEPEVVLQLGKA